MCSAQHSCDSISSPLGVLAWPQVPEFKARFCQHVALTTAVPRRHQLVVLLAPMLSRASALSGDGSCRLQSFNEWRTYCIMFCISLSHDDASVKKHACLWCRSSYSCRCRQRCPQLGTLLISISSTPASKTSPAPSDKAQHRRQHGTRVLEHVWTLR